MFIKNILSLIIVFAQFKSAICKSLDERPYLDIILHEPQINELKKPENNRTTARIFGSSRIAAGFSGESNVCGTIDFENDLLKFENSATCLHVAPRYNTNCKKNPSRSFNDIG